MIGDGFRFNTDLTGDEVQALVRKARRLSNQTARLFTGTGGDGAPIYQVQARGPRGQHLAGPIDRDAGEAIRGFIAGWGQTRRRPKQEATP